jgi:hypothetical protein
MSSDDLVTFNTTNKMLRSVPGAFGKRPHPASNWIWKPQIDPGVVIESGTQLADVQWENDSMDAIVAPEDCAGKILWLNERIDVPNLSLPFARPQDLLQLE